MHPAVQQYSSTAVQKFSSKAYPNLKRRLVRLFLLKSNVHVLPTVLGGGTVGLQMDFLSFFSFFSTPLTFGSKDDLCGQLWVGWGWGWWGGSRGRGWVGGVGVKKYRRNCAVDHGSCSENALLFFTPPFMFFPPLMIYAKISRGRGGGGFQPIWTKSIKMFFVVVFLKVPLLIF